MKSKELQLQKEEVNIFNKYTSELKNQKKLLKIYSQNIQSYYNINNEHKNILLKEIKELDNFSSLEYHPFHFLKDFQKILNIQYCYFNNFWEKTKKYLEHMKDAVDLTKNIISTFLSNINNLEENLELKSQFISEQNNLIMNSFQETEYAIAEDYFKRIYKINFTKNKQTKFNKDQLIEECHRNEKDFLFLEKEINNSIKKCVQEYNSNINNIKSKIIELYKTTNDDAIKISEIFKEEPDKTLFSTVENIQSFDINKRENEPILSNYLNYQIKEEEFVNILKIKHYKFKIKDKIDVKLNKIFEFKQNKENSNLVVNIKDIYNIIEQIYSYNFLLIDKNCFSIDLEKNKIVITEKLGKILGHDFFQNAKIKDIESLSEEDTNNFINFLFLKEEYLIHFLSAFNIYRAKGKFELSEKQFNFFKLIFCKISDYLLEHNNIKLYRPLIILSQTFYKIHEGKKYFLQKEIKNKEFFVDGCFWVDFLEITINDELSGFELSSNKMKSNEEIKKTNKNAIIYNIFLSLIPLINDFEIRKESLKNILIPIMEKYNISEEIRNKLFSLVDSLKK